MKKQKQNYRFHDPNDPAVAAEYILKVFVEANQKKVEKVIREASREKEEQLLSVEYAIGLESDILLKKKRSYAIMACAKNI